MAALALEKYAMFFILFLIVLIASMNTISLLFMFITHKKRTIGLLSAMGMSRAAIMKTFITLGMGITFSAACVGLAAAIGISLLLEEYHLISLPDVYYVSHLARTHECNNYHRGTHPGYRLGLYYCMVSDTDHESQKNCARFKI